VEKHIGTYGKSGLRTDLTSLLELAVVEKLERKYKKHGFCKTCIVGRKTPEACEKCDRK
jgi:hypothetical protein